MPLVQGFLKLPHACCRRPVGTEEGSRDRNPGALWAPPCGSCCSSRSRHLQVWAEEVAVQPLTLQPTPSVNTPHNLVHGQATRLTSGHSKARVRTRSPGTPSAPPPCPLALGPHSLAGPDHLFSLSVDRLHQVQKLGTKPARARSGPRARPLPTVSGQEGRHPLRQQDTKGLGLIQRESGSHAGRPRGEAHLPAHPARGHQNKRLPPRPGYWLLGEAPGPRRKEQGHGTGAEGGPLSIQPGRGWSRGEALQSEAALSSPVWTSLPGGAAPPC